MKKTLLASLLMISIFPALAEPITDGIYTNLDKKVYISSTKIDDGGYLYTLIAFPNEKDIYYLNGVSGSKLTDSDSITLKSHPSMSGSNSTESCQNTLVFAGDDVEIIPATNCSVSEKAYKGIYKYSRESSVLPTKYRGYWGENNCLSSAIMISSKDIATAWKEDDSIFFSNNTIIGLKNTNDRKIIFDTFSESDDGTEIAREAIEINYFPDGRIKLENNKIIQRCNEIPIFFK